MSILSNIQKTIKEIVMCLAQDEEIQKLLLVDSQDVSNADFTPLSPQEMLDKKYICLTHQTESGISELGRNTLLIITCQYIDFNSMEDDLTNVDCNIFILTNINNIIIDNYEDRGLRLVDCITQCLDSKKFSSSSAITVNSVSRQNFSETYCGYQLRFSFYDQNNTEVEF